MFEVGICIERWEIFLLTRMAVPPLFEFLVEGQSFLYVQKFGILKSILGFKWVSFNKITSIFRWFTSWISSESKIGYVFLLINKMIHVLFSIFFIVFSLTTIHYSPSGRILSNSIRLSLKVKNKYIVHAGNNIHFNDIPTST